MTKPVYPVHSYPWYVHDWRQSRARLRLEPLGRYIYRELLDEAYLEGSLSDEPVLLAKICDVPLKDFLRHWSDVSKNFDLRNGVWHHPKVDEVLANIEKWKDQRASAGRASGAARRTKSERKPNENERSFNGRSTAVEASSSSSTTTTSTTTSGGAQNDWNGWDPEAGFQSFLTSYPLHRRNGTRLALGYYLEATGGTEERHLKLMALLERCKASEQWAKDSGQYITGIAKFLQEPPWHILDAPVDPPVRYKSLEELEKEAWG